MAEGVASMKMLSVLLLILCGCSESAKELTEWQQAMRKGSDDTLKTVEVKSDAILSAVKQNDTSIKAVWTKLEALDLTLAALKPQTGKDGDPKNSPPAPESPAKANTQQAPLKVATPGTSQSETLVELATRLYAQGVNTHMKTREQLEAIDAQLNGGQPVTGAIFQNNRTGAVTSQRSAVRLIPRGKGVVRWQRNTSQQTCGPNGCY